MARPAKAAMRRVLKNILNDWRKGLTLKRDLRLGLKTEGQWQRRERTKKETANRTLFMGKFTDAETSAIRTVGAVAEAW